MLWHQPSQWNFPPKDTAIIARVSVFPLSVHKVSTSKPTGYKHPTSQSLWHKGSANSSGFLALTTAINTRAAKNRTRRGKYGQGVLQRLRHFLHYKNKLLFCLPWCPLFIYQACTWQFRKLCTQANTESGLPQWSMFRMKVYAVFTYFPFFSKWRSNRCWALCLCIAWQQPPSQKLLSWTLLGGQPHKHLYTDSCLSNIHALHFSTHTKKYSFIKMHMT